MRAAWHSSRNREPQTVETVVPRLPLARVAVVVVEYRLDGDGGCLSVARFLVTAAARALRAGGQAGRRGRLRWRTGRAPGRGRSPPAAATCDTVAGRGYRRRACAAPGAAPPAALPGPRPPAAQAADPRSPRRHRAAAPRASV